MTYKHILVAIDLTEDCLPVVQKAQALANDAELELVHIIEPMAMAFGGDVPMDLSLLQEQQFEQARARLDTFATQYPELPTAQRHLLYGQPRQEVHRLAGELGCDLIVVGSHGRHGLALLLGSTTDDILHGAPCDVLAVRLSKNT
ncbi:universal stress protein [Pseudomonas sp. ABC1]|uniref:universal stress protein n=1 Tax=Pseudomonas sp. ABC1 TaxID=2748080 RepID=UPI0015C2EE31|nr:universal stress protein [Pseudomonas sp. ABC1]QLF91785.1 universal stress protein [Pseudomonas sp. ABC1]